MVDIIVEKVVFFYMKNQMKNYKMYSKKIVKKIKI